MELPNPKRAKKPQSLKIGTRESQLAKWQAFHVRDALQKEHPDITFEVVGMTTEGDKDQNTALTQFSSKGVFTKELDIALLDGSIDIAVHCMKDLPTTLVKGLAIGAVLERGDTEDAVVMHEKHAGKTLRDLPEGSVVGTSALRRRAVLGKFHPHLVCKDVRGNVNTRLRKLDSGDYDCLILAKVGLLRLGMKERVSEVLEAEQYGYAVGQGALGVVCRQDDQAVLSSLEFLDHKLTRFACNVERGLLARVEGGCKLPVLVRAIPHKENENQNKISFWGCVLSLDGKEEVEHEILSSVDDLNPQIAWDIGAQLGTALLESGGEAILDKIKKELATAPK